MERSVHQRGISANAALHNGDVSEAVRLYSLILEDEPGNVLALCNRAIGYHKLDLYRHCMKDCNKALKNDPTCLRAYLVKGHALTAVDRHEEAYQVWAVGAEQWGDAEVMNELQALATGARKAPLLGDQGPVSITPSKKVPGIRTDPHHTDPAHDRMNTASPPFPSPRSDGEELSVHVKNGIAEHTEQDGRASPEDEPSVPADAAGPITPKKKKKKKNKKKKRAASPASATESPVSQVPSPSPPPVASVPAVSQATDPDISVDFDALARGEHLSAQRALMGRSRDLGEPPMATGPGCKPREDGQFSLGGQDDDTEMPIRPGGVKPIVAGGLLDGGNSGRRGREPEIPEVLRQALASASGQGQNEVSAAASAVASQGMLEHGSGDHRVDEMIALGYLHVNTGSLAQGIQIFDTVLASHPRTIAAFLGRGTGYALKGDLINAMKDFTSVLALDKRCGDAWKRRGQSRAALGDNTGALADLQKAIEISPDSDTHYQRGLVFHKMHNYRKALKDFQFTVRQEADNHLAVNFLALCTNSLGDCMEAIPLYERAVKLDPNFKEAWANMAQAFKDYGVYDKAEEYFSKSILCDPKYVHAYQLRSVARYAIGEIDRSIADLNVALQIEPDNMECLHFRAMAHHTLGHFSKALKDYDAVIKNVPDHIAWYQRVSLIYHRSKYDEDIRSFNQDRDMDPYFKEAWCKKHDPNVLKSFRAPRLPRDGNKDVDHIAPLTEAEHTIAEEGSRIGSYIQYRASGFLKNQRQHRACGLSVLEGAPAVMEALNLSGSRATSMPSSSSAPSQTNTTTTQEAPSSEIEEGGDGSTDSGEGRSPSPSSMELHTLPEPGLVDGRCSSASSRQHVFGYRDLFDIIVRWRQYSEPNDAVWWVDLLSPEQFAEGFGSHTPMVSGQTKVARYYPAFKRAFVIARELIKDQCLGAIKGKGLASEEVFRLVDKAKNCGDLYKIMGRDFWVVTPCASQARPGHVMEGTRLTMQFVPPDGYEFSIRTPCTPPRWKEYDAELTHGWNVFRWEATRPQESFCLRRTVASILKMSYYWYNFMPLSRGSAFGGYTCLATLLLTLGYEIRKPIPKDLQIDWEAILCPAPELFVDKIMPWVLSAIEPSNVLSELPASVAETFPTLRHVLRLFNKRPTGSAQG